MVIAVTGGIACGKSTVGGILKDMAFSVCDADQVAHDLMRKGSSIFQQVVTCFGQQILAADGEISRPILGNIVFKDSEKRKLLNELVHPAVRERLSDWITKKRAAGQSAAVLIPLLFESGMQDLKWDAVICVSSCEDKMRRRLEKRGLSKEEAEQRIASQLPLKEKEKRADLVILNAGTLGDLETATRKAVDAVDRVKGKL